MRPHPASRVPIRGAPFGGAVQEAPAPAEFGPQAVELCLQGAARTGALKLPNRNATYLPLPRGILEVAADQLKAHEAPASSTVLPQPHEEGGDGAAMPVVVGTAAASQAKTFAQRALERQRATATLVDMGARRGRAAVAAPAPQPATWWEHADITSIDCSHNAIQDLRQNEPPRAAGPIVEDASGRGRGAGGSMGQRGGRGTHHQQPHHQQQGAASLFPQGAPVDGLSGFTFLAPSLRILQCGYNALQFVPLISLDCLPPPAARVVAAATFSALTLLDVSNNKLRGDLLLALTGQPSDAPPMPSHAVMATMVALNETVAANVALLPSLTELDASACELESAVGFASAMPALRVLRLRRNRLTLFAPYIGDTHLQQALHQGLPLASVPAVRGAPSAARATELLLRIVDLSNNQLPALPVCFGRGVTCMPGPGAVTISAIFPHLEEIDLSDNQLGGRCYMCTDAGMPALQRLNLRTNRVTELRLGGCASSGLGYGGTGGMGGEDLVVALGLARGAPAVPSCPALRELNAANNLLSEVPRLSAVGIAVETSGPQPWCFPDCCQHLSILDLLGNRIDSLEVTAKRTPQVALPHHQQQEQQQQPQHIFTLSGCRALERLDLSNNNISALPPQLCKLVKLKAVVLDGNPLRSIRRDLVLRGSTVELMQYLRSRLPEHDNDEIQMSLTEKIDRTMAEVSAARASQQLDTDSAAAPAYPQHHQGEGARGHAGAPDDSDDDDGLPLPPNRMRPDMIRRRTTVGQQLPHSSEFGARPNSAAGGAAAASTTQQQRPGSAAAGSQTAAVTGAIGVRQGTLWDLSYNDTPAFGATPGRVGRQAGATATSSTTPLLPDCLDAAFCDTVAPRTRAHVQGCTRLSLEGQSRLRWIDPAFLAAFLPALEEINATRTKAITTLAPFLCPPPVKLKTLIVSGAGLTGPFPVEWLAPVPAEAQTLQHINLSANRITSLPAEFGLTCSWSLVTLNLNDNSLTAFPETVLHLRGLCELHLARNQIGQSAKAQSGGQSGEVIFELPPNLPQYLPALAVLDLSYNQLSSPVDLPLALGGYHATRSMRSLRLQGNVLRWIKASLLENPGSTPEVLKLLSERASTIA